MSPRELAEDETPLALAWIASARGALAGTASDALLRSALETNFAWREVRNPTEHLRHIERTLSAIVKVLELSRHYFADVSLERAREVFSSIDIPPAYTLFEDRVYFTPEFKPWDPATMTGFGRLCRTAMVVHEAVHIFDRRSGEREIHVSEWDERYASRTAEQQLHNPSAYASLTAQIHERRLHWPLEARYGAGHREI